MSKDTQIKPIVIDFFKAPLGAFCTIVGKSNTNVPNEQISVGERTLEDNNIVVAVKAVDDAETYKDENNIQNAWHLISTVGNNSIKSILVAMLNDIDFIFIKANKRVNEAISNPTRKTIVDAILCVQSVSKYNPNRESLVIELESLRLEYNTQIVIQDSDDIITNAIYYVERAKKIGTVYYNAKAQYYVDQLEGVDDELKAELQENLNQTKLRLTDDSTKPYTLLLATNYVEFAESYKMMEVTEIAQKFVDLISVNNTEKIKLQSRLNSIGKL